MNYDFSHVIDRSNSASVKFDLRQTIFGRQDVTPMWVADMDFATPPFIIERMAHRLAHPILGYTLRSDEFDQAIVGWMNKRYLWAVDLQWISFSSGIVAGLNHAVQAFSSPSDRILIQTPVYHPFFSAIKQNNRELVTNPLILKNNRYSIDFNHLEQQLASGIKIFILCNPHNPVGRVWTESELLSMAHLCLKHKVLMVSDEIHADLIYSPNKHIPLASLSPEIASHTITFGSASKTFNIAGLSTAYVIIPNPVNLKRYNHQLELNGTNHGNIFGYEALKAAYSAQGEEWLDQLLRYLSQSVSLVRQFLLTNLPSIKLIEPEGTYLLWLDFREMNLTTDELNYKLIHEAGIGLNAGEVFGTDGFGFQRMNIGCPQSAIEQSLNQLEKVFGIH